MHGILIIDKPAGLTSHDVVARVRRILKTKRVGHTGTLDPFATGVMVLLIGQATRLAQFLDKDEKEYEAIVRFGFETDTGDRAGVPSADRGLRNEEVSDAIRSANWDDILVRFRGEIEQTPPMYSAKKVEGKKLYELARKGIEIERKPVRVTIHQLEIVGPANGSEPGAVATGFLSARPPPVAGDLTIQTNIVILKVTCSAGTYIRTLAKDIGRALGTGAHLQELRRIRAGKFLISQSVTLEELQALDDPADRLIPMNEAVSHLPKMTLADERIEKTRNGLSSRPDADSFRDGEAVRMLDVGGKLIAVGVYDETEKVVRPKVVLL